jgi:hypothetical protein
MGVLLGCCCVFGEGLVLSPTSEILAKEQQHSTAYMLDVVYRYGNPSKVHRAHLSRLLRMGESRKVVLHAGREKKKMWGRQHTQQLDIYLNTSSLFFGLYRDGWMERNPSVFLAQQMNIKELSVRGCCCCC